MHDTALEIGKRVFEIYARPELIIVELGARDVNGTLRLFRPKYCTYIGLDFVGGPGVDIVIEAGVPLPFENNCVDLVVASSTLEHDPFFWETFIELARITKNGGIIYINSPSNGKYHRYDFDYWRFYPDCGVALEKWARKNGQAITLVESFTALRKADVWNDFVALFVKDTSVDPEKINFVSDSFAFSSAWRIGHDNSVVGREFLVEDMIIIEELRDEIVRLKRALQGLLEVPEREFTSRTLVAARDDVEYRADEDVSRIGALSPTPSVNILRHLIQTFEEIVPRDQQSSVGDTVAQSISTSDEGRASPRVIRAQMEAILKHVGDDTKCPGL